MSDLPENLDTMSSSALKKLMKERGVRAEGCTEKSDLIAKLKSSPVAAAAGSTAEAAPEMPEMPGFAELRQFAVLPMVWLCNKIDWEDVTYLWAVRIGFVVMQVTCILIHFMMMQKIKAKADQTMMKHKPKGKPEEEDITVEGYDLAKVNEGLMQLGMGTIITLGIHYKWSYVQPLFIQLFMGPMTVWDNKVFQIHMRGQQIERPFKEKKNAMEQWAEKKQEEAHKAQKEQGDKKEQ